MNTLKVDKKKKKTAGYYGICFMCTKKVLNPKKKKRTIDPSFLFIFSYSFLWWFFLHSFIFFFFCFFVQQPNIGVVKFSWLEMLILWGVEVCIWVCVCVCMRVYVCVCVFTYLYVYVYNEGKKDSGGLEVWKKDKNRWNKMDR